MTIENPPSLAELRQGVTEETALIVASLLRRTTHAMDIGKNKADDGATQIRDLDREAVVLTSVDDMHDGTVLSAERMRRVIQVIMDVTSETQAERTGLPIGEPAPAESAIAFTSTTAPLEVTE